MDEKPILLQYLCSISMKKLYIENGANLPVKRLSIEELDKRGFIPKARLERYRQEQERKIRVANERKAKAAEQASTDPNNQ